MKILYLECNMGIAGDMLMAALWDLMDDKDKVLKDIKSISLPYTDISFDKVSTCSVTGYRANVIISGEKEGSDISHHQHRNLADINTIIDDLSVSDTVKNATKEVYNIIAAAESKVHNQPVTQIHFHELGMLDAVADITVCNFLIEKLAIDKIIVSPIHAGNGNVKCAHGIMPVPAPATAEILKGILYYKGDIQSELCTPTGAALAKFHSTQFGNMPDMIVDKIGYGVGAKEFECANCIRAFIGHRNNNDEICELTCNIDDMTGEEIAYACDVIRQSGAVDVSVQPLFMKKGRVGILLRVMCNKDDREDVIKIIFKHTSTIGIREYICERFILDRDVKKISTPFGDVRVKYSSGYNSKRIKIESDDVIKIAKETGKSIYEIKKIINSCLN